MGAAALPAVVGAQAAGGAFSAYAQGQAGGAASKYYSYLASTSRTNADLAEKAGQSQVKEIGAQTMEEDRRLGERVRSTVGAQQTAFSAGGVGATSKTAEQIVSDTMTKGNIDEMALRYNAAIKTKNALVGADSRAMNERGQAAGYDIAGFNAVNAARLNQTSTILGTGGSVASNWYRNYYTG